MSRSEIVRYTCDACGKRVEVTGDVNGDDSPAGWVYLHIEVDRDGVGSQWTCSKACAATLLRNAAANLSPPQTRI